MSRFSKKLNDLDRELTWEWDANKGKYNIKRRGKHIFSTEKVDRRTLEHLKEIDTANKPKDWIKKEVDDHNDKIVEDLEKKEDEALGEVNKWGKHNKFF